MEVMGPPDIEKKVGLTGGHIFQGECLPGVYVVAAAPCAHADGRRLSMRRMYASRRKCDCHQRSKCRYEYPSGFREFLRPLCPDTFVDGFIADMLAMTRGGGAAVSMPFI